MFNIKTGLWGKACKALLRGRLRTHRRAAAADAVGVKSLLGIIMSKKNNKKKSTRKNYKIESLEPRMR